jgi:hypothetical protein
LKKNLYPTISGVLMLVSGVFSIVWLSAAFARIVEFKDILRVIWVISPVPYFGVATGFGGNAALANLMVGGFVVGIPVSIIGGAFALHKRPWWLALVGSIGAFVCVPVPGLAAIILVIKFKNQWLRNRASG